MSASATRVLQQEITRLRRENEAQQEQIRALYRYIDVLAELCWTAQRIAEEENPLVTLSQCISDVMEVVGAGDGSLACLDEEAGELIFTIVHGLLQKLLLGHRIERDVGVVGWVIENADPVVVNNPRQDWRFSRQVDDEFSFLTRSIICAPVMRGGKPIGAIELLNKEPHGFTKADATMLSVLCYVAAVALEGMGSYAEVAAASAALVPEPGEEEQDHYFSL